MQGSWVMQGCLGNGMLASKQHRLTNWLQVPCCDQFAKLTQYVLTAQASHRVTLLLGAYHVPLLRLEYFLICHIASTGCKS